VNVTPLDASLARKWVLQAMPMVLRIARRLLLRFEGLVEEEELIAVGKLAAVEQTRRLDPRRADRFDKYAFPGVFGAMMEHVMDCAGLKGARRELMSQMLRGAQKAVAVTTETGATPAARRAIAADCYDELGVGIMLSVAAGSSQDPEAQLAERQVRAALRGALGKLGETERRIVERHWFEEVPLQQVGAELGMSRTTVKARHRRALVQLAALMARWR
jgi:RNA polymerase sigma factor (sigma-70 family)